jgi:hypothetical protein
MLACKHQHCRWVQCSEIAGGREDRDRGRIKCQAPRTRQDWRPTKSIRPRVFFGRSFEIAISSFLLVKVIQVFYFLFCVLGGWEDWDFEPGALRLQSKGSTA